MGKVLMVQGTGSHAGKSLLAMEREYGRLADLVSRHPDMDAVRRIAGLSP